MTTPLAQKIKRMVSENGPISVADYFALCLADPEFGYYRVREPFGRAGDFITAPEISQLFGEMIGIFFIQAWQAQGKPGKANLVEIGPGRGTLMADALRTIEKLAPDFYSAIAIHMIETSERLKTVQRQAMLRHKPKTGWHNDFATVPEGFTLLVANELFDAIPIRQFVKTDQGFLERMITIGQSDKLEFGVGPTRIEPALLPDEGRTAPDGALFEVAPARTAIMIAISEHLKQHGGTALIIDYGYLNANYGDTLQAVWRHQYDPPLARPGEADLTSHVDFEALAMAALASGAHVHRPLTQGEFLLGLGLLERAGSLGNGKDSLTQATITDAVNRLAGEGAGTMGQLFKVMCISGAPIALAPFDRSAN